MEKYLFPSIIPGGENKSGKKTGNLSDLIKKRQGFANPQNNVIA